MSYIHSFVSFSSSFVSSSSSPPLLPPCPPPPHAAPASLAHSMMSIHNQQPPGAVFSSQGMPARAASLLNIKPHDTWPYTWYISRRVRNRRMHALHGNTSIDTFAEALTGGSKSNRWTSRAAQVYNTPMGGVLGLVMGTHQAGKKGLNRSQKRKKK